MAHDDARRVRARLGRRAALTLPLLVGGCGLMDTWFGTNKIPLPGTRENVLITHRGLDVDPATRKPVTVPAVATNTEWPQPGGSPTHSGGHFALSASLGRAWSESIGSGGGYREKITAQPVISGGRVFTMDSDGVVSAFDLTNGGRVWRQDTQGEDNRSTNIGGGISTDGKRVYAATGRGEAVALDAGTGAEIWRQTLAGSARAAPTVFEGHLLIPTLGNLMLSLSAEDGKRVWGYQAPTVDASMLGLPSPAAAEGLVVTGTGGGDLQALRANSGSLAWGDSLAAVRGNTSLIDLSTIRGMAVIQDQRVYAIGLGQLMLSLDLRSGRRLWEREVASGETPWLAGDWLFIVTTAAQVAAINRNDGSVSWITQLDSFQDMKKSTDPIAWMGPVLAGGRLIVAGTQGMAASLDPVSGAVIGQQQLSGPASVAPVVVGGTLYIITDDGTITAYR